MFPQTAVLNKRYQRFGQEVLSMKDLQGIAHIMDTRFQAAALSESSHKEFVKYSDTEKKWIIYYDSGLDSDERTKKVYLAIGLGHLCLYHTSLPDTLFESQEDVKIERVFHHLLSREAFYFALCCFIPGDFVTNLLWQGKKASAIKSAIKKLVQSHVNLDRFLGKSVEEHIDLRLAGNEFYRHLLSGLGLL